MSAGLHFIMIDVIIKNAFSDDIYHHFSDDIYHHEMHSRTGCLLLLPAGATTAAESHPCRSTYVFMAIEQGEDIQSSGRQKARKRQMTERRKSTVLD